jgi:hypothetical protein
MSDPAYLLASSRLLSFFSSMNDVVALSSEDAVVGVAIPPATAGAPTEPLSPDDYSEFLARCESAPALTDRMRPYILRFNALAEDREDIGDGCAPAIFRKIAVYMAAQAKKHSAWATATPSALAHLDECVERFLAVRTWERGCLPSASTSLLSTAWEARQQALKPVLKAENLELPACANPFLASSPSGDGVDDGLFEATWKSIAHEFHCLHTYKTPADKLVCLVNTCRLVAGLVSAAKATAQAAADLRNLQDNGGEVRGENRGADERSTPHHLTSADDLLPGVALACVMFGPPDLPSHIAYVSHYRNPSLLRSEAGYFLTLVESAIHFLLHLEASHLYGWTQGELPPVDTAIFERNPSPVIQERNLHATADSTGAGRSEESEEKGRDGEEVQDPASLLASAPKHQVPLRALAAVLSPPVSAISDDLLPEALDAWLRDRTSLLPLCAAQAAAEQEDAGAIVLSPVQVRRMTEEYTHLARSMKALQSVLADHRRLDALLSPSTLPSNDKQE